MFSVEERLGVRTWQVTMSEMMLSNADDALLLAQTKAGKEDGRRHF